MSVRSRSGFWGRVRFLEVRFYFVFGLVFRGVGLERGLVFVGESGSYDFVEGYSYFVFVVGAAVLGLSVGGVRV